ncbi:MAG: tetratricopeptide repeat protein [Magnetococcales bacterium]|nr:tetratricopeptide repeat protein [Magnetococcales bacterium]
MSHQSEIDQQYNPVKTTLPPTFLPDEVDDSNNLTPNTLVGPELSSLSHSSGRIGHAEVADTLLTSNSEKFASISVERITIVPSANPAKPIITPKIEETEMVATPEKGGWLGRILSGEKENKTAEQFRSEGTYYLNRRSYKQAVKSLEKAIELGVEDLQCQLGLSLSYARSGRLDEAIALLNDLKTSHPKDPGVATLLGKALLFNSQYHTAIKVMRPVAAIHKDRFNLHFFLGLAFAKSHEYDSAIDAWSQAAKIRPDDAETRRMLARALDAKQFESRWS